MIVVGTKEEEPEPEPVYEAAAAYTSDVALDANGAPVSYSVLSIKACLNPAVPKICQRIGSQFLWYQFRM